MITKNTATDIAMAHREIEAAEELLKKIQDALRWKECPDIRDAFGRRQSGLQLGVPAGDGGQRLFNVSWQMAEPVIKAHIEKQKAELIALCEKARGEINE